MQEIKKLILIVDGDEILRNGMRLLLEMQGYTVEEACNGKEAVEILNDRSFDLVISEFEMPELDGIQLLDHVKAKTQSRFLLTSEHSIALQAKQALQLGADQFLNKPFSRNDFSKAVEDAFKGAENQILNSLDLDYVQVPIDEFVTGTVLKVDLFLRISDKKYLKIGHKGGSIEQNQIQAYKDKGLNWLYMRKPDFAFYVGFNISLAQQVHSEKKIECARKIRLTMHVTETLISQLRRAGLNRQELEDTSNVIINAVELIQTDANTLKLLESMEIGGSLPAHCIAVSIWSCLIAKKLGWSGQSTFFKIAICALFHDIGQKELDDNILSKPRFELNRQEVKIFEGHTTRGRDILMSVPGMPEDIITVALQHHELYRGGGFPHGLKFQQIHPLASLVGLADRLCEILKHSEKDARIVAAYEQLYPFAKDFDPTYFKALTEVIKSANNGFKDEKGKPANKERQIA